MQPLLLLAVPYTLKRVGVPHRVESGEPSAADKKVRNCFMRVMRIGGLRDAPSRVFRHKSLRDVTHETLQARVNTPAWRRSTRDHGQATAMHQPPPLPRRKHQHFTQPGLLYFFDECHKLATFAVESFCNRDLGVEHIHLPAGGERRGGEWIEAAWRGRRVEKETPVAVSLSDHSGCHPAEGVSRF